MANIDFLNVLAGLNVEESSRNIHGQLQQISKNYKGLDLKLNVDTSEMLKAFQNLPTFDKAFSDLEKGAKASLLQSIREDYKDFQYEVTGFTYDVAQGTAAAKVQIKDLAGTIREATAHATLEKAADGSDIWKTLGTGIYAAKEKPDLASSTDKLTKSLKDYGKTIADLTQLEKQRELTTTELAVKAQAGANATEELTRLSTGLSDALRDGSISESQYVDLTEKMTLARANFERVVDASRWSVEEKERIDTVRNTYQEYLETLRQVGSLAALDLQGKTTAADKKQLEELVALQKEQYEQLVKTDAQFGEKASFKQAQEAFNQSIKEGKEEFKTESEEVSKLLTLMRELNKAYSERNKVVKQQGLIVDPSSEFASSNEEYERAEARIVQLRAAFTELYDKVSASPYEKVAKEAAEVQERMLDNIEKQTLALQTQQERQEELIRGSIYRSLKFSTSGTGVEKLPDNLTLDPKALAENHHQLEELMQGLGMYDVQIRKNVKAVEKHNQVVQQFTVTTDNSKKFVKDITFSIREFTDANGKLQRELYKTDEAFRLNNNSQKGFLASLSDSLKRLTSWIVVGKVVYSTVRKIGEGFRWLVSINEEITQSAIVQGVHVSTARKQLQDYVNIGKQMGMPALEIAKVTTELQRQGLTLDESRKRMQTVIKLSTTGMTTVEQSMQAITAAVNALEVHHKRAADVLLKASQISASDVEGLGEALSKTASSAAAAGLNIEQVTGMTAGLIQVTQEGASTIGNFTKTLLARFNRVDEETGEFNATLNDTHAALASIGVEYTTADGQMRNTFDVLRDTAAIWDTLTKNQQAYIATVGAGVRMQSRFYALMQDFETIDQFVETLQTSEGTLESAFDIQLTGMTAQINKLKASVEDIWSKLFDQGAITTLLTNLAKITEGFASAVGALNKLNLLFPAIASAGLTAMDFKQHPEKITNIRSAVRQEGASYSIVNQLSEEHALVRMLRDARGESVKAALEGVSKERAAMGSLRKVIELNGESYGKLGKAVRDALNAGQAQKMSTGMKGVGTSIKVATTSSKAFTASLLASSSAALKLNATIAASALISMGQYMLLAYVVGKAVGALTEFFTGAKAAEAMNERLDDTIVKLEAIRSGALSARKDFEQLAELQGRQATGTLSIDEYTELAELSNRLAELAPSLVAYYDDQGNAVIEATATVEDFNNALKEQQTLQNKLFRQNFGAQFDEIVKKFKETRKETKDISSAIDSFLKNQTLSFKDAKALGLDSQNTNGLLIQQMGQYVLNSQAEQTQIDNFIQMLQTQKQQTSQQFADQNLSLWKQAQPVIQDIGAYSELAAEGMKALSIVTRGIDASGIKSLSQYEGAVQRIATTIKANESEFASIFDRLDEATSLESKGDINAEEYNRRIAALRQELENLITTLELPVSAEGIINAIKSIADEKEHIYSLIESLKMLRSQIDQYGQYADKVNDISEELRDTGTISIGSLVDAVELSKGMLDVEELLLLTDEQKLVAMQDIYQVMHETMMLEKERELNAAKADVESKKRAYSILKTDKNKTALDEAEQQVKQIEAEMIKAAQDLNDVWNFSEQANAEFDRITNRLSDFNGFLNELKDSAQLSFASQMKILESYPELIPYLTEGFGNLKGMIASLAAEEEKLQYLALKSKIENSEQFYRVNSQIYASIVKDLANKYNLDVSNFRSAQDAKMQLAAAAQKVIANLNAKMVVATSTSGLDAQIAQLAQDLSRGSGNPDYYASEAYKQKQASLEELKALRNTFASMDSATEEALSGIKISPLAFPKTGGGKEKTAKQQFADLLLIMPRYAAKLDDLSNSYDNVTKAHDSLFKRLTADKFLATTDLAEYIRLQKDSIHEMYTIQGRALSQQKQVQAIVEQAANSYKKSTKLQVDAHDSEAAFLNWKQLKETEIFKLDQAAKMSSNDAAKDAYSKRSQLLQHEIKLAEYHRNTWRSAADQLETLSNEWWSMLSSIQSAMEEVTNKTIEQVTKYKDAIIETQETLRGVFGRYDRSSDLHNLDLLMLDLKKLRGEFASANGTFNTIGLENAINRVDTDTRATMRYINELEKERKRIMEDTLMSEIEKQEAIQKLLEKQYKLEKEINTDREIALETLQKMELHHREIENAMQHRIELKQDELAALKKQKEYEEKVRQEQEKQLNLLKAMDDTRFSYITALGEEIFTFDRSKLKDLESSITPEDMREKILQEELEKMQKELEDYKEANRIEEETLRSLITIQEQLFSTLGGDIGNALSSFEKLFDKMIDKLTESTGQMFEKWFKAQEEKDSELARSIIEIFSSMETLMKSVLNGSLPTGIASFDSGGYTGNFGSAGRLAVLHEKELVLNAKDTELMLQAVREMKSFDALQLSSKSTQSAVAALAGNNGTTNQFYLNHCKFETENVSAFGKEMQGLARNTIARIG